MHYLKIRNKKNDYYKENKTIESEIYKMMESQDIALDNKVKELHKMLKEKGNRKIEIEREKSKEECEIEEINKKINDKYQELFSVREQMLKYVKKKGTEKKIGRHKAERE